MSVHELLLIFHILCALLLVAGSGIATYGGIRLAQAATPTLVLERLHATKVGGIVATIFGSLTLPTGIAVGWELGFDLLAGWLIASYALWMLAMTLSGMQKAHGRRVAAVAATDEQRGDVIGDELRALLDLRAPEIRGQLLHLVTLVFLVVMIVRPGA